MAAPRLEVEIGAITSGLKKGLDEARREMAKFARDAENGSLSKKTSDALDKEAISLAKLKTEAQKYRTESAKLTLERRKSRKEQDVLNGSYREAQRRLTELGRSIRDAEGGFTNMTPEVRSQIEEYRKLNEQLKEFDSQMGLNYRRVGDYRGELGDLFPALRGVDMQLRSFGTSIKEVTSSGSQGFQGLGMAVKGAGSQLLAFASSPIGLAIAGVAGLVAGVRSAYPIIKQFDSGLLNVAKTTGLTGSELDRFGDGIVKMSRELKTVGTDRLLEYATVAGQLGVKGRDNILAFSNALAQLEQASNITGEEGGADIARLLNLVDGGVSTVGDFGDEIVNLGNNFAATEKEILHNATAIAQNTGLYKLGRQDVLAYATATKAVGLEAEVVGSAIFRSLAQLEKLTLGGENAAKQLNLLGVTQAELSRLIKTDSAGAMMLFIDRLNEVNKSGGSVTETLAQLGMNNVRDVRVLGTLASSGYGQLNQALQTVRESAGAMGREFETASSKLENQTNRIRIAWENIVLSMDKGRGVIGGTVNMFVGGLADILEKINQVNDAIPTVFNEYRKGILSMNRLNAESGFWSFLTGGVAGAGAGAYLNAISSLDVDTRSLSRMNLSKELQEAEDQYNRLLSAQQRFSSGVVKATNEERQAINKKTADAYFNLKNLREQESERKKIAQEVVVASEDELLKNHQNSQAISEIKRLTDQITRESLSEYDRKLFDISKKYDDIYSKISDPNILGLARQNEAAERLRVTLGKIASEMSTPMGIGGLTGALSSGTPNFDAWRSSTASSRMLPNKEMDKRLQNRLERVV